MPGSLQGLEPKKKFNGSLQDKTVQVEKTKPAPGGTPQRMLLTFLPCRKVYCGGDCLALDPFNIWIWLMNRQHACASLEPVRSEKPAQAMGTAGKNTTLLPSAPKENQTAHASPV